MCVGGGDLPEGLEGVAAFDHGNNLRDRRVAQGIVREIKFDQASERSFTREKERKKKKMRKEGKGKKEGESRPKDPGSAVR